MTIPSGSNIGLFGIIEHADAVVRNLMLENVTISGGNTVGGIAGQVVNGTIENTYVSGTITGTMGAGGITGGLANGIIRNNYTTATVRGESSVGGIVGSQSGGTISHNVALNPSISRTSGGILSLKRVIGSASGGTRSDNYAFVGMTVLGDIPATDIGANDRNGESITLHDIYSRQFWFSE